MSKNAIFVISEGIKLRQISKKSNQALMRMMVGTAESSQCFGHYTHGTLEGPYKIYTFRCIIKIKIMKGKGQSPKKRRETKKTWLYRAALPS
tara:strand:- start:35 stop:310 length:276 start_codon:yes stop_codon:yes gene_type:complete